MFCRPLLRFFPSSSLSSAVPFFSHNFNNTTVIIPPINVPKKAPFQNSSAGNNLLVCPDKAQITPHTVKEICSESSYSKLHKELASMLSLDFCLYYEDKQMRKRKEPIANRGCSRRIKGRGWGRRKKTRGRKRWQQSVTSLNNASRVKAF